MQDPVHRPLLEICSLDQTLQYEPVPFHRTLTIEDVRRFFETGLMPMDEPDDGAEHPSTTGTIRCSSRDIWHDPHVLPVRVHILGGRGMQVEFTKYETGPGTLMKATKAVGYDVNEMKFFNPEVDPESLNYVIYEQVFRDKKWWKPRLEDDDDSDDAADDRHQRNESDESSESG